VLDRHHGGNGFLNALPAAAFFQQLNKNGGGGPPPPPPGSSIWWNSTGMVLACSPRADLS